MKRAAALIAFSAISAFGSLPLSTIPAAAFYYPASCNKIGCFCAPGDTIAGTGCEHQAVAANSKAEKKMKDTAQRAATKEAGKKR